MAGGRVRTVLRQLKSAALVPGGYGVSDAQLLEQYLAQHSEIAFEALLRRHGPMVYGVCRRVLANNHDAEDAFQATFLVLVRKGQSIWPRSGVGHWLYGVAYRTSMKARAMNAKRRAKETAACQRACPPQAADLTACDLQAVLDQELHRLGDKYRVPLILCDLEGKTRAEAARQIGCPAGTVATRLVKARALLAKRLTRRGLTLSAGGVALVLGQAAAGAVPAPLLESTMTAASAFAARPLAAGAAISAEIIALTEEVLRTMSMSKCKTVVLFFLAAGMLTFGAFLQTASPQANVKREVSQDEVNRPQGQGPAAGAFLAVGKSYDFTPAANRQSFRGKVLAVRGEQWVRIDITEDDARGMSGATWINLNHIASIADAVEGGPIKGRFSFPEKK
jgi:RNA polymerase sigma factor (sigma-70 family)